MVAPAARKLAILPKFLRENPRSRRSTFCLGVSVIFSSPLFSLGRSDVPRRFHGAASVCAADLHPDTRRASHKKTDLRTGRKKEALRGVAGLSTEHSREHV